MKKNKLNLILILVLISFCWLGFFAGCGEEENNNLTTDEDYYNSAISLGYTDSFENFKKQVYSLYVNVTIQSIGKNSESHIIITLSNDATIDLGYYEEIIEDLKDSITISNRIASLNINETLQLEYTSTLLNPEVIFTSSNDEIATVTNEGLLKGISDGIVSITATANQTIKDSFTLVVKGSEQSGNPDDYVEPSLSTVNVDLSTLSNGEVYTINEAKEYIISGTNSNAQIIINASNKDVILTLNNANLTFLGTSSPIQCTNAKSVLIKTVKDTINTITDSTNNKEKAVIQVKKCDLNLSGEGKLICNGYGLTANDSGSGIYCSKNLTFNSGNYEINCNDNGIAGKESLSIVNGDYKITALDCIKSTDGTVTIYDGIYNLTSTSDGIQAETIINIKNGQFEISVTGDGIKATNSINITNGTFDITSQEDGIKASGDETNTTLGDIIIDNGSFIINSLSDGIQAENYLLINNGSLDITSGAGSTGTIHYDENNEAISSKGLKATTNIIINSGIIKINSLEDAIHSNGTTEINDGDFTIITKSDGISSDTTLYIKKGTFDITSSGNKGLKATGDLTIDNGTFIINTIDDAIHSNSNVTINNGTYTISTSDDGMHADNLLKICGGDINIKKSYEGLEGSNITILNGNIHLVSSDDGINAAGGVDGSGGMWGQSSGNHLLTISGGYLYVNANGDGLDANGSISMSGGTVIVFGPTNSGNGSLDYDRTFNITGGFLMTCGSSGMAQAPSSTSTQYIVSVNIASSQSANKAVSFTIDGTEIVIVPPKTYQNIVLSTPEMQKNSKVEIKYNGTCTGDVVDGICKNATYSGTALTTLTLSSIITSYGSGGSGFPGGPGRPHFRNKNN